MSTSGLTNQFIPSTLDGLVVINADAISVNGQDIDINTLVPYTGADKPVDVGVQPIRTNYAPVADADVVNLLTLQNAILYIDGVNVANFVKYTGSNSDTDLGTFTISSSTAPASGNVLTNKTYVDTQAGLRVPYTGGTANLNLGSNNLIANTAQFTAITSATPALALGVDGSGNLNTFAVPVGTNLLPLNNTWTGVNTFDQPVSVGNRLLGSTDASPTGNFWMGLRGSGTEADRLAIAIAGDSTTGAVSLIGLNKPTTISANLTVNGDFRKEGGNSGANWLSIRGTDTLNSPYIEFFVNSLRRSYIGYATTTSMNVFTENGATLQLGTEGIARMTINTAGKVALTGELTVAETSLIGFTAIPTTYPFTGNKDLWVNGSIYSAGTNAMVATFGRNTTAAPYNDITFVSNSAGVLSAQIKSHTAGSSIFNDATWTYSNTNANPLGSNQGQVLLQADKMSMSLTSGFIVGGLVNIHGGSPSAVPSGHMAIGSLTIGDVARNYGGGTTTWNTNTAGLLMECLDNTEIAVHDAGARVSSLMYYTGANNTFTMGRNMGWGVSDVVASNNLTANCLIVNGGGTYQAGCIYSDANWGMLFRAKVVPTIGIFLWNDSAGGERMRMNTVGQLILTTVDGPGFVHTNGTVIVESYIGGAGGWFGTRTNHPLRFYANNSSARMTLNTGGDMTHTAGDSSYMNYGPNSTWNSNLIVGATPDRAGVRTAQVITTNGNLHLDAGNSNDMYYGYYANSRGTPNAHLFYGSNYQFIGVPQNEFPYAHVACFFGDRLRRSQCMMREVYKVDYIAWGGGINMVDSFYKYNALCPVKISGKYSGYVAGGGVLATMVVRVYSQSSGVYRYYPFITYQNQAYVQTTYPFELILSSAMIPETGWFDIYVYSSYALITDINNQLHVNVQLLPVDAF